MEQEQAKKQIQLNLDPNVYLITLMNIGFNEEFFNLLVASGNQAKQYSATPKHAKRIYLLLKQQVEKYEEKYGEIITKLPEKPQSTQPENKIGF